MKLELSYNELFWLGSQMDAEYIDYNYYSAIDDIDTDFELFAENVKASLSEKGLLEESFDGITVNEELNEMLKPAFFSLKQSEINIFPKAENERYVVKKLHFLDDRYLDVDLQDTTVTVRNDQDFEQIFKECNIPEYGEPEEDKTLAATDLNEEEIQKIAVIKRVNNQETPLAGFFLINTDAIYRLEGNTYHAVSYATFKEDVRNLMLFEEA